MNRKILMLVMAAFVLMVVSADAAVDTASGLNRVINKIERYVYGDAQEGQPSDRLRQIEEDLFGRSTGQKDSEKAGYIHDFLFKATAANPSLDMKLSFLEWKLFNKTGEGNLAERLAAIDQQITGFSSSEPLAFRLEQQVHMTIENGLISVHQVTIPQGTSVKMRLTKDVSSRSARKNDIIPMVLIQDLFIGDNILVMSRGGIVSATVKSVRRGGRFGRTGYVNLDVTKIESMDSTELSMQIDDIGEKFDKKKIGLAAGASTLGYLVLGPIGIAGGAFIKGGEVEIPAGTEISVRTSSDVKVLGVLVHKK